MTEHFDSGWDEARAVLVERLAESFLRRSLR